MPRQAKPPPPKSNYPLWIRDRLGHIGRTAKTIRPEVLATYADFLDQPAIHEKVRREQITPAEAAAALITEAVDTLSGDAHLVGRAAMSIDSEFWGKDVTTRRLTLRDSFGVAASKFDALRPAVFAGLTEWFVIRDRQARNGQAKPFKDSPKAPRHTSAVANITSRLSRLVTPPEAIALQKADQGTGSISPWWAPNSTMPEWLGHVWAWWWRLDGLEGHLWKLKDPGPSRSIDYKEVPLVGDVSNRPDKFLACLVDVPNLVDDSSPQHLNVMRGDYHLVKSIERLSHTDFRTIYPEPSPFGFRRSKHPWPGNLVAHVAVTDPDGWLLLHRRNSQGGLNAYMPGQWSASFEEHVDLLEDHNLSQTIIRGCREELSIGDVAGEATLQDILVTAIGREVVPLDEADCFILNSCAVAAVVSPKPHRGIWDGLVGRSDWNEHESWAAVRFKSIDQVDDFLNASKQSFSLRALCEGLGVELEKSPRTRDDQLDECEFHPTSALRILITSHLGRCFAPGSILPQNCRDLLFADPAICPQNELTSSPTSSHWSTPRGLRSPLAIQARPPPKLRGPR